MQSPPVISQVDAWAPRAAVVGAAIGLAGVVAADGGGARLEVAVLTVVTLTGFLAKARWPRLPPMLLVVWTFGPPVVLNLRERGEGTMFLLIVALCFLVMVTPGQRVRIVAGAAALLAPPAVQAVRPQDWGWPFWMMGIGFGWLSSEQMRRFNDLVTELAATRELLAEQAVDVERRRIAAELHDVVGHSLTVVLLSVTGARRLVRTDPDAATEALLEAEAVGRASLAEIRGSVRALRDDQAAGPAIAPMPAAADLPELVERMVAAGSEVDLDITGDVGEVEPVTGLVVYRVVQESLNNTARHAPGQAARVAVAVAADAVDLEVFDAGGGTQPNGSAGVGLLGMRERVEAVGGTPRSGPRARGMAGPSPFAPPSPRVIAVVLVDDQPLVRAGLQRILSEDEGFTVVAQCSDGAAAVAAVESGPADVVLMDVRMRGMDGIQATRRIRELGGPPVLVLTTFDDDDALWGPSRPAPLASH